MDLEDIWQAALGELEVVLSKANFTTWFKGTALVDIQDSNAIIAVPNIFTKEWFEKRYNQEIIKTLRKITNNQILKITYQIKTNTSPQPIINPKKPPVVAGQQDIKDIVKNGSESESTVLKLRPEYTFDSFIVGSTNRLAYAASMAVSQTPGKVHNPLVIYGGVGLGKTHLIHAIGNALKKNNSSLKLLYTSCEDFANDFVQSIQSKKTDAFKKKYRSIDIFLVDDIQFLSRKEGTQEEFFHTFNALHQNDRQIVMTADRIPTAIPDLEDRLSSRFAMGMVADILPPDFETRLAILKEKSQQLKQDINQEILSLIAESFINNIRELEGALNRVIACGQMEDQPLTIELARQALKDQLKSKSAHNLSPNKLLDLVAAHYGITIDDISGKRRKKEYVRPRHMVMYLLRSEFNLSYPIIGDILSGKDHTTIMHGVNVIERELGKNDQLRDDLSVLRTQLYSGQGAA